LGLDDINFVDEKVLGFFSILSSIIKENVNFDLATLILDEINFQLSKLRDTRSFKYPSFLVYLMLYS